MISESGMSMVRQCRNLGYQIKRNYLVMDCTKPNFFLAGAPKCGTTSMWHYLNQHPDVFMSSKKEPNYFSEDFPNAPRVTSDKDYMSLFSGASHGQSIVGEGSVNYFYSKVAARNINLFNPDAKILIMLRNPLSMIPAQHAQFYFVGDENIKDFEVAWDAQHDREDGKRVPSNCRYPELLNYRSLGQLSLHVERFQEYWPAEQLYFVLMDDFKDDFAETIRGVFRFLNVDEDYQVIPEVINSRKEPKSALITKMLASKTPQFITKALTPVRKALDLETVGLKGYIRRWNRKKVKPVALSDRVIGEMRSAYQADLERLQSLIGRDLSTWIM